MTLAGLRARDSRRAELRGLTFAESQAEAAVRLMRYLLETPAPSWEVIYRAGFALGFLWAKDNLLIVWHKELWRCSKHGQAYLALLERGANRHDLNLFLAGKHPQSQA